MKLKPIDSEEDYEILLEWIDIQLNNKPDSNTKEGEILQDALNRIKAYEDIHYKIPSSEAKKE